MELYYTAPKKGAINKKQSVSYKRYKANGVYRSVRIVQTRQDDPKLFRDEPLLPWAETLYQPRVIEK